MRRWMLGIGGALLAVVALSGCTDGSSNPQPVYETIDVVKSTTTKGSVDVEIAPGGLTVDFPVPAGVEAAVVQGLSFDFDDGDAIDARLSGKAATLSFGTFTGTVGPFEITTADGKLTGTATIGAASACSLKVLTADAGVGSSPFSVDEVIALETLEPQISVDASTQTVVTAPTMLSGLLKSSLQETAVAASASVLRKAAGGVSAPPTIDASQYRLNDQDIQTRLDGARARLNIKRLNGLRKSSTPKVVSADVMASKGVALDIDADPETGVIKVNVAVGDTILDLSTITLQQDPSLVVKTFKTEITEIVTKTNPGTGKVEQVQTIVISDGAGNKLAEMTVTLNTVSTVVNGKTVTETVATLAGTTQSGITMSAAADVTKSTETVAGKVVETQVINKTETQNLSSGEKKVIAVTETKAVVKDATSGALVTQDVATTNTTTQTKSTGEAVVVKTIETTNLAPDTQSGGIKETTVANVVTTEKDTSGTAVNVTEVDVDTTTITTVATDPVTGITTEEKVVTEVAEEKDANGVVVAITETAKTESKSVSTDTTTGATTEALTVSETTTESVVTGGTVVPVSTTVISEEIVTTVTAPDANGLVSQVETTTTNQVITDETTGATTETTVTTVNTETELSATVTENTTEVIEITGSTTPPNGN